MSEPKTPPKTPPPCAWLADFMLNRTGNLRFYGLSDTTWEMLRPHPPKWLQYGDEPMWYY